MPIFVRQCSRRLREFVLVIDCTTIGAPPPTMTPPTLTPTDFLLDCIILIPFPVRARSQNYTSSLSLRVLAVRHLTAKAQRLGACPRIGRGRVPGLEGADARRRDAGDVGAHRRGAPTKQMPIPSRNPKGAWGLHDDRCVTRRQRCAWTSLPPRALRSPCKPHARDPFEFSDRLLGTHTAKLTIERIPDEPARFFCSFMLHLYAFREPVLKEIDTVKTSR